MNPSDDTLEMWGMDHVKKNGKLLGLASQHSTLLKKNVMIWCLRFGWGELNMSHQTSINLIHFWDARPFVCRVPISQTGLKTAKIMWISLKPQRPLVANKPYSGSQMHPCCWELRESPHETWHNGPSQNPIETLHWYIISSWSNPQPHVSSHIQTTPRGSDLRQQPQRHCDGGHLALPRGPSGWSFSGKEVHALEGSYHFEIFEEQDNGQYGDCFLDGFRNGSSIFISIYPFVLCVHLIYTQSIVHSTWWLTMQSYRCIWVGFAGSYTRADRPWLMQLDPWWCQWPQFHAAYDHLLF